MAGRRPLKLDKKLIESYASLGCTDEEIAVILKCSPDTLTRRFKAVLEMGRAKLNMSIRRSQVRKALNGDNVMLIWLGKNRLGQKDKVEHSDPGRDNAIKQSMDLGNGVKVVF